MNQKGGKACSIHVRQEIDAATIDKWLQLSLFIAIVKDARRRGTVLNRRYKELPKIHDQYNTVSMRFDRRCERLGLNAKTGPGSSLFEELGQDGRLG